jgi:hypothetical protein
MSGLYWFHLSFLQYLLPGMSPTESGCASFQDLGCMLNDASQQTVFRVKVSPKPHFRHLMLNFQQIHNVETTVEWQDKKF